MSGRGLRSKLPNRGDETVSNDEYMVSLKECLKYLKASVKQVRELLKLASALKYAADQEKISGDKK